MTLENTTTFFVFAVMPYGGSILCTIDDIRYNNFVKTSGGGLEVDNPKAVNYIEAQDPGSPNRVNIQQSVQPIHFSKTKQEKAIIFPSYIEKLGVVVGDVLGDNAKCELCESLFNLYTSVVKKWRAEVSPVSLPTSKIII